MAGGAGHAELPCERRYRVGRRERQHQAKRPGRQPKRAMWRYGHGETSLA
ncbi:hypothetical protein Thpro_021749 [Acidihalobacter prosperus]|uniref:Uncharacterized protein n=1 Tax=Acidihalobacter prosperus TaxID=160660 RepID=A0A1A6C4D1_9GAMM|nr:hypothetical protein Thpro_021749 [Acidihalobacter prosperus]